MAHLNMGSMAYITYLCILTSDPLIISDTAFILVQPNFLARTATV